MTSLNENRLDALAYFAEMHNEPKLALRLAQLPADAGDAPSEWYLGYLFWLRSSDPDHAPQAAFWLKKAADQGLAAGYASLGALHCTGSLPKDSILGEQWRQKALVLAEPGQVIRGHQRAYENRLCLRRDYSRALKWYVELAKHGNAEARWLLGNIYHRGIRVKRSFSKALNWYRKAADLGHSEARESVRFVCDVPQYYESPLRLFHRMADRGNTFAQFVLSLQYGQSFGGAREGSLIYLLTSILAHQMSPESLERKETLWVCGALANGLSKLEIDDARRMGLVWQSRRQPVNTVQRTTTTVPAAPAKPAASG